MHAVTAFFHSLYLTRRFFWALGAIAGLFVAVYFAPVLAVAARMALVALAVLAAVDLFLLYRTSGGVEAHRNTPERFSNGDRNAWTVRLRSSYPFDARLIVVDELPVQFQARREERRLSIEAGGERSARYAVRPTRRGVYAFGALNVYVASPLGLVERRFRFEEGAEVPVYPSFLQMRRYELLAASNRLEEIGIKKVRRVGHTMEFDHIREYVVGDDYRRINWKATARRDTPMVNQYRDERGQPVYSLIDTGRVMKMPFQDMTLLDYAINASLVLSSIALMKEDRAGLVTFSHQIHQVIPAERRGRQIYDLQEALYHVETDFKETDMARLATFVRRNVRTRGLLLLFTNFETHAALERQLLYLKELARHHTVVVIFFENTALRGLLEAQPETTEEIYVKTIAEKFSFEKREIVRTLRRHGCQAILTPPQNLSVQTINKYLALKARGVV